MIDTKIIAVPKENKGGSTKIVNNIINNGATDFDIDNIDSSSIVTNNLTANTADIANLSADTINVTTEVNTQTLNANETNTDYFVGVQSITDSLYVNDYANITDLDAEDVNISDELNVSGQSTFNGDITIGNLVEVNFDSQENSTNITSSQIYSPSVQSENGNIFNLTASTANISTINLSKVVNGVRCDNKITGDKIELTKVGTTRKTTITNNDVSTYGIYAADGVIDNLSVDNYLYAENATIQSATIRDLLVTGTAHFYELIIDKIKSTQGQIILTPASAKLVKVNTLSNNRYECFFRATDDDGKAVYNPFTTGDQVICQTFNINAGKSHNVSNKFYWVKVSSIEDEYVETISIGNEEIECWTVTLDFNNKASNSNGTPEVGDEIVLLGSSIAANQAAIIISAYENSYLDSAIKAPSIVQYAGINDFNLSNHRRNVISKNENTFKGQFKTNTGDDIEELIEDSITISSTSVTYAVTTSTTQPADSSFTYTTIPTVAKGSYLWTKTVVTYSDNTSSKVYSVSYKGTDGEDGEDGNDGTSVTITSTSITYAKTTSTTQPSDSSFTYNAIPSLNKGDYLWSKTIVNYSNGTSTKSYSVSRIGIDGIDGQDGQDGQDGENAEEWIINPDREEAYIDTDGNLDVRLGYQLYHVVGNERTLQNISSDGYHYIVYADKADSQHSYFLMTSSSISKNNFITDYYNVSSANRPSYFNVYLCYGTNNEIVYGVPCRNIIITYSPMASLEVKNDVDDQGNTISSIQATVAGHTTDISGLTNEVSQLTIEQSAITTNVTAISNKVDNLNIGSTQLLRGINKMGSLTTVTNNATWTNGGWKLTSGGNGTGSQFTLTDSPNKICTVGWRISGNTSGNRDFAQYNFPWVANQEYTIAGYARAINGSGAALLIRVWDNTASTARVTYTKTLSSGSWQRFSYTFTLPSSTDINNSQIAFGLQGNCSAEFCAMKLEKGNVATDFSENPYDIDTELNTLTTDVSEVKQTASSLTSTVTALQTQVDAIPLTKKVTVDATSLSESTFYPVSITFNFSQSTPEIIRCKVTRNLDSSMGVPSYSTHSRGFILDLDWNTHAGGWGALSVPTYWSTSDTQRFINDYQFSRVTQGEIVVGSIMQNTMNSAEIVYVRGGSKYYIETSWENSTIALNPNGYSWTLGSTYSFSAGTKTMSQVLEPIKDTMSQSQIKQTAKEITQTVTSPIIQGDTNNLFYPACYNSDGMTNEQNQFLVTSYSGSSNMCSSWGCSNYSKYGKPVKDSKTNIEIGSTGEVYLYTPWVSLDSSKYYTLSFGGSVNNTLYIDLCRYSSQSNAIKAYQTIAATTLVRTISNDTFTYNQTLIKFQPSTTSSYYRIRFRLADVSSATPILNLNNISLYEGDIAAGKFADWNYNISKSTSVISQTADKIQIGVEKAGINLSSGKITSIADKFEWQNNNGQTILGLNSNGDAEFNGTVKAKNFYHAISLAQWIQNNSSYPNWNVKYNVNGGLYITNKSDFENDYNIHDLVPSSELATISTGDLIDLTDTAHYPTIISLYNQNYQMDGATPCIGYADEAIFMTPTSTSGSKFVILPPASKCQGKIVTVYNKAYSNVSISVKSANTSDKFSPVAYYSSGQALVSGNSGQSINVNNNQWIKLMALSNGWLALSNGSSTFT